MIRTAKQLITLGFRDDIEIGLLTKDPVRWGVKSTAERNKGTLRAIWLIGHAKCFKILQQHLAILNLSSVVNDRCEHYNITHLETKALFTFYLNAGCTFESGIPIKGIH